MTLSSPADEDLLRAPGEADLTFGSLLTLMVASMFRRVETLDPDASNKFYTECTICSGTDEARRRGSPSQISLVAHREGCSLAKHLTRLRVMANTNVT